MVELEIQRKCSTSDAKKKCIFIIVMLIIIAIGLNILTDL